MSTQLPVTDPEIALANAASAPPALAGAFWGWLTACALAAAASLWQGGDLAVVAGAAALAFSIGVAGFVLLPDLSQPRVGLGLVATWLVAGVGLVAGTGGAYSPLAAILLAPPALAALLRLRWTVEIAAAAVLAYPLAAWIGLVFGPTYGLGPFAQLMAAAAIVFAGALGALSLLRPQPEAHPQREAALNKRVAEVAHELRTPLNHILGFADAIESQVFGPVGDRNKEYAGFIRESGKRLLELINDMLDLSKIDAGELGLELENFNARALIDDVVREFAHAAETKGVTISVEGLSEVAIRADKRAWRRILTNTLGNALKFTPQGGRVTISARREAERFILDTIDTGPGIPAAERERLGKPYQRGEGGLGAEGTGLGLSLVRALAHAHGGALTFHDGPGGGALVRVEAPIISAVPA